MGMVDDEQATKKKNPQETRPIELVIQSQRRTTSWSRVFAGKMLCKVDQGASTAFGGIRHVGRRLESAKRRGGQLLVMAALIRHAGIRSLCSRQGPNASVGWIRVARALATKRDMNLTP